MHQNCILNMGIAAARDVLDLNGPAVEQFAAKVMQNTPVDKSERLTDKPRIELYQRGKERRPREIEITPSAVQAAGGVELSPADRVTFVKFVADAAEQLFVSKLDLKYVDVRFIFRTKHWGNHHKLVADVFWPAGPLANFLRAAQLEPFEIDWDVKSRPSGDDNLLLVATILPRTAESEIRSGAYDGDEISLMLGLARVGGFLRFSSFGEIVQNLLQTWDADLERFVVRELVDPLVNAAKPGKA